uniref:Nardilysin n=1 Tax=Clastoptera arizonana TaxID=38151 RepID=A0A1B6BXU5_9HEMI
MLTLWKLSRTYNHNMSKRLKLETKKALLKMVHSSNCNQVNNVCSGTQNSEHNVIYLPSPVTSEQDNKEYSAIKLPNGLTALLISDVTNIVSLDNDEDDFESNSENEISENEDDSEGELEEDTDAEQGEKLAACALSIGVGSFSDPEKIQGLAHFLEHMIFMGSDKYPLENEFDNFIKKSGGSDNASTECEYTTFYFDCHEKHLFKAMDIFSNFFASPLMKKNAMQREREAVEAEFQMALPSDSNRSMQIIYSTASSANPVHKFMWGNLKTLRDGIDDNELHESVHEFKKRHYSAHRMTLAIQARLPMKTLEDWVIECFSSIPSNELPADNFKTSSEYFLTEKFCKLYTVEPVKDQNSVRLTWVLPPIVDLYKSKPLNYISWLIGHEGKGSLSSYLQKNLWALEVGASCGEDGAEQNSLYTLFSITIYLTTLGLSNLSQVLTSTFEYIKLLKTIGPSDRIFKEIQLMENIGFKFKAEINSADYVESLVEQMQVYPSTDYITGNDLYFEYKPELIEEFLNKIKHDNVNILLLSKLSASKVNLEQVEPWFGTKYNVSDIPSKWVQSWKDVEVTNKFHLPDPNPFITSNFILLTPPNNKTEYPDKIYEDDVIELWYKQDSTFKLPTAIICLQLISSMPHYMPHNAVMQDLLITILIQTLAEEVYSANMANLQYSISPSEKGIVISVQGFNEKLNCLLQTIIKYFKSLSSEVSLGLFNAMKENQRKDYYNKSLKSNNLARDTRMSLLLQFYWTSVDKHNAISSISFQAFQQFCTSYLENLNLQCLIQGNISKEEAIKICLESKDNLQCKPLLLNTFPEIRVCQIPTGKRYCKVQSFNSNDTNSVVTNYYQSGPKKIKDHCICELLILMMQEPLFDTLRTKEQLGYDVSCTLRDTFGILGFSVKVSFQIDKFSADHVENRITLFLEGFLKKAKKMSKEEFQEYKETLIKLKQSSDIHISEEVKRNWEEIKVNEYIFDRRNKEKKYIEEITLEEVCKFFENQIQVGNNRGRIISFQVIGHKKQVDLISNEKSIDQDEIDCDKPLKTIFHGTENLDHIVNIQNYKQSLLFHHINKVD